MMTYSLKERKYTLYYIRMQEMFFVFQKVQWYQSTAKQEGHCYIRVLYYTFTGCWFKKTGFITNHTNLYYRLLTILLSSNLDDFTG